MTKIQGKYSDLKLMFDRLKLQGKDETKATKSLIYNCILKCYDNVIKCNVLNMSCTVLGFFEFNNIKILEEGELCIGNLEEFSEFLYKFSSEEDITIETTDEKLVIKKINPKKKALLNLIAREHIEDSIRADEAITRLSITQEEIIFNNVPLKNKYVLDVKLLKDVLADAEIKGITTKFTFFFSETEIKCLIGKDTENKIETEIPVVSGRGTCKGIFQGGIDSAINNLTGNITIFISDDAPMFISSEDENSKCKFVIAQAVE